MSASIFRVTPPSRRDPISQITATCTRAPGDRIEISENSEEIRFEMYTSGARYPSIICLGLADAKLVSRGLVEQAEASTLK